MIKTEPQLAQIIINYFENQDWIAYKEVSKNGKGGSSRNDCYFVKKENDIIKQTIALETKMSLSIKVLYQANKWKNFAHEVYVAVPKAKRKDLKMRKFLYDICKNYLKIGVIEVDTKTLETYEIFRSSYNPNPKLPPLYEEQKNSEAGNSKGEFHTAFKNTVNLLIKYMDDKDKVEWKQVISDIPHHYKTYNSAYSALKQYVGTKIIPNFHMIQEGKKWYIVKTL